MPRRRLTVLVVDPAGRLQPLLAAHPSLVGMQVLAITGPPGPALAERALDAVREHDPAVIVLDFLTPHEAMWQTLVHLRRGDPRRLRSIITTTDAADSTAGAAITRVGMLLRAAIAVGVGGAGLGQVIAAIQDAVQRQGTDAAELDDDGPAVPGG